MEMFQLIKTGFRELVTNMPYVGRFLSVILSCFSAQTIAPTAGVETAFSFALLTVLVGGVIDRVYQKPDKTLSINIVDTIIQVITLVLVSILLVSTAVVIINSLLEFIRSFNLPYWGYTIILLLGTIAILLIYAGFINKKPFKQVITLLIIDLCISLLVLCLCAMFSVIITVGGENLVRQDLIVILLTVVGISTIACPYMIWLKLKYQRKFKNKR